MKTAYLLSALVLASLLFSQYAFAANDYYAGYGLQNGGDKFLQITGRTRFNDSTVLPTITQGAVVSMSGLKSGTSTTPNGMVYQSAVELRNTGSITGQPNIFRFQDSSPCFNEGPTSIGTFGSNPDNTNFVYWVVAWNSARTTITFYYENHKNNGNVVSAPEIIYNKSFYCAGDDSGNFLYGHKDIVSGSTTYRVKFLQFGIEGPLGQSNNGWKARQYDMTIYGTSGGNKNLSSLEARTTKYTSPTDNFHHSWVTQKDTQIRAVGKAPYTLDADYPAEGTAPSGNVIWFYGGPLAVGTKLWP